MSRTLSHHNEKNSASCSSSGWHKSPHGFLMLDTVTWNPRSTREVNERLTASVFGTFVLFLKAQFSFGIFLEIETWILDESEMHIILSRRCKTNCKVILTTTALAFPIFFLFLTVGEEGFFLIFLTVSITTNLELLWSSFQTSLIRMFCTKNKNWCRILFSICNFDFGPNFCQISNTKQNTNSHFNFFCWLWFCFVFTDNQISRLDFVLSEESNLKKLYLWGLLLQTTKQIEFELHFQQQQQNTNQTTQNNTDQQPATICTITNKQHKVQQNLFEQTPNPMQAFLWVTLAFGNVSSAKGALPWQYDLRRMADKVIFEVNVFCLAVSFVLIHLNGCLIVLKGGSCCKLELQLYNNFPQPQCFLNRWSKWHIFSFGRAGCRYPL